MSKFLTMSVPRNFSEGPLYDEDGDLTPSSWPPGQRHSDIKGWVVISELKGALVLCDFTANDDYPISTTPGNWKAVASYIWDGEAQQEYDESGDPIGTPYNVEVATDEAEYQGYFPDDTEYKRHHSYLGWPTI